VIAFDHDMMSFVDAIQDEWPVIVITNPKVSQESSSDFLMQ